MVRVDLCLYMATFTLAAVLPCAAQCDESVPYIHWVHSKDSHWHTVITPVERLLFITAEVLRWHYMIKQRRNKSYAPVH